MSRWPFVGLALAKFFKAEHFMQTSQSNLNVPDIVIDTVDLSLFVYLVSDSVARKIRLFSSFLNLCLDIVSGTVFVCLFVF